MQKPCSREPPFSARLEATAASSLVAVAHSIAVAVRKTSDGTRCATHTRRVSVVYPPPKGTSSPEQVPFDRIASFPGPAAVKTPPLLAGTLTWTGKSPSALSSSHRARHHP